MGKQHIPGELRDVDVQFVSLVSKGANGRTFKIFKSADAPAEEPAAEHEEMRSFFGVLKQFFTRNSVEKAEGDTAELPTFGALIGQREMRQDLAEARWLLSDVIEAILGSEATNKAELIAKACDEFKAYILGRIQQVGVAKALDEIRVEKVGRKISAARMAKLKDALAALQSIIDEVESDEGGDVDVNKAELQELVKNAIGEAVAPLNERIAKLEGANEAEKPGEEILSEQDIAKMVGEAVAEAVKPLQERLEVVEKARGLSNAAHEEEVEKSDDKSFWGGIFL